MGARRPLSEATKRKISEAQRGKSRGPYSAERRKAISNGLKGKPKSPEHRANLWRNRERSSTYGAIHQLIRFRKGNAKGLNCVDCGGPGYDWSLKQEAANLVFDESWPGWFSTNIEDYEPRCRSCHAYYDRGAEA